MRNKSVILVTEFSIATVSICCMAYAQLWLGDHSPSLVYEPRSGTYFSVYQTYAQSMLSDAGIDPWGNSYSRVLYIEADEHAKPAVGRDTVNDTFLIVWTGGFPYNDLLGLLGGPEGGLIISSAPGAQANPVVTNDSINSGFLVTWLDDRNIDGMAIYGQLVGAEGRLVGTEFLIASGLGRPELEPPYSVTYDHVNQRFLVVYLGESIFGQLIDANGMLQGEKFITMQYPIDTYYPIGRISVAYDDLNQRHLVVWDEHDAGGAIFGQLVSADGTLLGTTFTISPHGKNPSVAFDNVNQRFLVAWTSGITDGQFVNGDGALQGDRISISQKGSFSFLYDDPPSIAFNPRCGNFLVASVARDASQIKGTWTTKSEINYTVVGDPCPAATLTVKKKGYRAKKSQIEGYNGVGCKRNSCKYIAGSGVTITAIPDDKAVFEGWTGCDTVMDNVCNVTMDGDKTVTAKFSKVPKKSR